MNHFNGFIKFYSRDHIWSILVSSWTTWNNLNHFFLAWIGAQEKWFNCIYAVQIILTIHQSWTLENLYSVYQKNNKELSNNQELCIKNYSPIFFRKKELKPNKDHPYWKVKLTYTEMIAMAVLIVMNKEKVSFFRIWSKSALKLIFVVRS